MASDPHSLSPMRPSAIRAANAGLVLARLDNGSAATRAELAKQTSLTPQALGPILSELVRGGLVIEEPSKRSGPGRPPAEFRLDPLGAATVSILIRFSDSLVVVTNAIGQTVKAKRLRHKGATTARQLVRRLTAASDKLVSELAMAKTASIALAVTVDGVIDTESQIVRESPAWKATNVDLGAMLREYFPHVSSIKVMSNERALAMHALDLLDAPPSDLVAVVTISTQTRLYFGVGRMLVSNRRGDNGLLAHLPVPGNERVCVCGRTGCFDTVSSGAAVVQDYFELTGEQLTAGVDVIERIGLRDPDAIEAARRSMVWLAKALGTLLELHKPDRLVFSGAVGSPGTSGAKRLVEIVRAELPDGLNELPIEVFESTMPFANDSPVQQLL